jgi:hypothetical protein
MDDFDKCEVKDGKIIIDLQTLKDAYHHYQDICYNVRSEAKQMYYSGIVDTILVLVRNIHKKKCDICQRKS